MMKNTRVFLMSMVAGCALLSPSSHAAIEFSSVITGGSGEVVPGGNFSVSITVHSTLTDPSTYWGNAGFNLVWNSSVLTLQATPVGLTGSPLLPSLGLGDFEVPASGQLNFNWLGPSSGPKYQVADGSTLFTVNFTVTGAAGSSTALSFASIANIGLTDASGGNFTFTTPTGVDGLIQVVPEPVNFALGLFAVISLGAASTRWFFRRRTTLRQLC